MISHATSCSPCAATSATFAAGRERRAHGFLPLCHIAERIGGEYHALYTGAVLNFVENPETVPENVREIAPTIFTAVPRVWEKFYSGVHDRAARSRRALQQWAYKLAIGVGYKRRRAARSQGKPVPRGAARCVLAGALARC